MRKLAILMSTAALLMGALTLGSGCTRVDLSTDDSGKASDRIERGAATEMDVLIQMGAGQLRLGGGAFGALEADYEYSQKGWRPEVSYDVNGEEGQLSLSMPSRMNLNFLGEHRYLWDIALPDDMPMDLKVEMGAGEAVLKLGSLSLRNLKFELGAGDATIDLVGSPASDLTADITAGAGAVMLRVPSDVGVRIEGARDGLGSYKADGFIQDGSALVNPAYESASIRYDIKLSRGVGDVTIVMVD